MVDIAAVFKEGNILCGEDLLNGTMVSSLFLLLGKETFQVLVKMPLDFNGQGEENIMAQ